MQERTKMSAFLHRSIAQPSFKDTLFLKSELMRTQKELIEAKEALSRSELYEWVYEDRYKHYMQKCLELEKENAELKTENKKLKLAIMAFKSVWNAHIHKKEA